MTNRQCQMAGRVNQVCQVVFTLCAHFSRTSLQLALAPSMSVQRSCLCTSAGEATRAGHHVQEWYQSGLHAGHPTPGAAKVRLPCVLTNPVVHGCLRVPCAQRQSRPATRSLPVVAACCSYATARAWATAVLTGGLDGDAPVLLVLPACPSAAHRQPAGQGTAQHCLGPWLPIANRSLLADMH